MPGKFTEVLVEGQENAILADGSCQHVGIKTAWRIGPDPSQIMSGGPKGFNGIAGEILVREKAHRQPAPAGVSG